MGGCCRLVLVRQRRRERTTNVTERATRIERTELHGAGIHLRRRSAEARL